MDKLGPYELVEQIDLAGYVWTARKGAGSPIVAVRFRPGHAAETRAAAETQKKFAAAGGGWAPIHDIGDAPDGGAYYACDFYLWSALLLFEQKDRLTSVRLLRLCDEVCAALDGRAHGNLKLSNILLSSRDLDRAKVFLSDPLPRADDAAADRRGVGRIIFELVTGTPFRDFLWPVQTGEKWDALGPDGSKWLNWCNRLLAPAGHETAMEPADFKAALESIRPNPTFGERVAALPWKRISAAAAVVVILAAGALIGLHLYYQAKLNAARAEALKTLNQEFAEFEAFTEQVEDVVKADPDVQGQLKRADILIKAESDSRPDLNGAKRIDEIAPLQTQAAAKIAAERTQWRNAAMETLGAHKFNNQFVDDPFAERMTALKKSSDEEGSLREAAQLVAGLTNLAAAWPSANDAEKLKYANAFGPDAAKDVIANPASSDKAIATFQGHLRGANPVDTAIADANDEAVAERTHFISFVRDLRAMIPPNHDNLYDDLKAAEQAIKLPSFAGIDNQLPDAMARVRQRKDAYFAMVKKTRDDAVAAALAKARKVKFGSDAMINQGFVALAQTGQNADPEKTLEKTWSAIAGLDQLAVSAIWKSEPALASANSVADSDQASIAAAYQVHLTDARKLTVQAIAENGEKAQDQIAALAQGFTQIHGTAESVQRQFQIIGAGKLILAEKQFPSSVETWKTRLEQMKTNLAGAKALSNWPNPAPEETSARIDDVLSAISSRDMGQLKKFADSAATPALLNAVCVNWPAVVHAVSPDDDYQIYQDVSKGLGGVPSATAKSLADLWSGRLKQLSDAKAADALWFLAVKMNLDKRASGPAVNYINDWIGYLQARYPQEKKNAITDFLDRTAAFNNWSMSEAQLSSIKSFRDKLTFVPKPGTGPLPSKDFARPIPGGDVIYTPPFDPNFTMRFKLMQKKPQGSYYLCTTEVPVGWFIELVDKGHAPVFKRLMDVIRPQLLAGPSAWAHQGDWIGVNPGWIAPEVYNNWSDSFHVDPAKTVKPMQYVSPLAAMDAARLIGCRLPTVQEWQLAYDEGGRDNDDNTGGPNWQALWATISAIQPAPGPASLTFPSFKAELPPAPAAAAAPNVNDVLWYRNVPRDFPTFHDMRGNVAEWVLDSADVKLQNDNPIKVTDGTSTVEAANQDDAKLNDFYKHCLRIGLTSTSSSNQDEKTARLPDDSSHKHHHQFFDVGFRLAMDDTPDDPEKFIAQAIKEMQLLKD